jgi:soluble lytic murein transglycosylase
MALFALNRIARVDAEQAVALLKRYQLLLPSDIEQNAWAQIALIAAKKLSPYALDWYQHTDIKQLNTEQRSWLARMAIRQANWAVLQRAIDAMPQAEQQLSVWQYWYAKALHALHQTSSAQKIWSKLAKKDAGYYGLLSREALDLRLEMMPSAFTPSPSQIAEVKNHPGIQRALALYQNPDWHPEASQEWNWAIQDLSDEKLIDASALAHEIGWYDRAIYAAEKTRETHNYRLRFPVPAHYENDIRQHALQNQIDPIWILSLIRQESRFAATAKSHVGALGLMQIMPATARWIAERLGMKFFNWRHVKQPDLNIKFGIYYLSYIHNSLGHPLLTTAGYNAGPNRPKRWLGSAPMAGEQWIETIPFDETRDYVKKVMANAIHYEQQINRQTSSLKQRLGTLPARSS